MGNHFIFLIIKYQTYKMKIFTLGSIAALATAGVRGRVGGRFEGRPPKKGYYHVTIPVGYYRHYINDNNCQASNDGKTTVEMVANSSCYEDFACRSGDLGPCQEFCGNRNDHMINRAECRKDYYGNESGDLWVKDTWCFCKLTVFTD